MIGIKITFFRPHLKRCLEKDWVLKGQNIIPLPTRLGPGDLGLGTLAWNDPWKPVYSHKLPLFSWGWSLRKDIRRL